MRARALAPVLAGLLAGGCLSFHPLDPESGDSDEGGTAPTPGVCQPACGIVDDCAAQGEDLSHWRCEGGACRYGACAIDGDCGSGGVCRDDPFQGTKVCAFPCPIEGCLPGSVCEGGVCVTAGCSGDDDCGANHVCDAGACWLPCDGDADCGNAQLQCTGGLCRVFACDDAQACATRLGGASGPHGHGWACVPP